MPRKGVGELQCDIHGCRAHGPGCPKEIAVRTYRRHCDCSHSDECCGAIRCAQLLRSGWFLSQTDPHTVPKCSSPYFCPECFQKVPRSIYELERRYILMPKNIFAGGGWLIFSGPNI